MGCGISSESANTENVTPEPSDIQQRHNDPSHQPRQTILATYQQFDEEICRLESLCPGPRLTTMDTWIQYLETQRSLNDRAVVQLPLHLLDNEMDDDNENDGDDARQFDRRQRVNDDIHAVTKVRQLAEKLKVIDDMQQAIKYEEFIASMSRRYMDEMVQMLRNEILQHARKRANELLEQYTRLRNLYAEQDALIASINGGNYTSANEQQMDDELESARKIRDKLGSAVEQWRTAANLLSTSAKAAQVANEQWNQITLVSDSKRKIELAIECRSTLLGSLTALQCVHDALPQVDIPHITQRQIVAVSHANEYLLTDIANRERYDHSHRVFAVYQQSLSNAMQWLQDVFKRTLKKDLDEAEDSVLTIAKKLRQYRVNIIQVKFGNKIYAPENVALSR